MRPPYTRDLIESIGDVEPRDRIGSDLEKQFSIGVDKITTAAIARALVELGDKKQVYWDYLVKEATAAVESDAPSPTGFHANGKPLEQLAPTFAAWAQAHNLTTDSAEEGARYREAAVEFLAQTEDRRAIPLLRRALTSPDFIIQVFAARALAHFQDKASIPLIIDACQRGPKDVAYAIASSALLFFDDSRARAVARAYIPADEMKKIDVGNGASEHP